MQLLPPVLLASCVLAAAAHATPAPTITTILEHPGIDLGAQVVAAMCDASGMAIIADRSRRHVAVAQSNGEITIWNADRATAVLSAKNPHAWINGVAWAPDGRRLAVASWLTIDLWALPRLR